LKKITYLATAVLLVVVSSMALVNAVNLDISDVYSTPNGYAEAIAKGSWVRLGIPYYSVQHTAKSHPSGLSGTVRCIGSNKYGVVLYDTGDVPFTGTYTYNPGIYNQIWEAQTYVTVNGETAIADIGPPGSR
jgi:hypothetical protein